MKMLIDSQWVEATNGSRRNILNPGTGEVIDSVPVATLKDAETALQAAQDGRQEPLRLLYQLQHLCSGHIRRVEEREHLAVKCALDILLLPVDEIDAKIRAAPGKQWAY